MDYKDLVNKKEADLQRMLSEERGSLYELRVKAAATPIQQHTQFKKLKKNIARILTALNSKKDQTN